MKARHVIRARLPQQQHMSTPALCLAVALSLVSFYWGAAEALREPVGPAVMPAGPVIAHGGLYICGTDTECEAIDMGED